MEIDFLGSQLAYSAYHQIVTFSDFLGNFQKWSTNTTKLENSSNRYGFLKILA